jgi:hypothetical protein
MRTKSGLFLKAFCFDRECMDTALKLGLQCGVDQSVLFDSRFAGKGRTLDPDAEMRFDTPGMNAGVAAMLVGFIDHVQLGGIERCGQKIKDSITN